MILLLRASARFAPLLIFTVLPVCERPCASDACQNHQTTRARPIPRMVVTVPLPRRRYTDTDRSRQKAMAMRSTVAVQSSARTLPNVSTTLYLVGDPKREPRVDPHSLPRARFGAVHQQCVLHLCWSCGWDDGTKATHEIS